MTFAIEPSIQFVAESLGSPCQQLLCNESGGFILVVGMSSRRIHPFLIHVTACWGHTPKPILENYNRASMDAKITENTLNLHQQWSMWMVVLNFFRSCFIGPDGQPVSWDVAAMQADCLLKVPLYDAWLHCSGYLCLLCNWRRNCWYAPMSSCHTPASRLI